MWHTNMVAHLRRVVNTPDGENQNDRLTDSSYGVLRNYTNSAILASTRYLEGSMVNERWIEEYLTKKRISEGRSVGHMAIIKSILFRLSNVPTNEWSERVCELSRVDGVPYDGETIKKHYESANAFLRWCEFKKYIDRNPFPSWKPHFKVKERDPRPLTKTLIREMLIRAEKVTIFRSRGSMADLLRFWLYTGLRTGELFKLELGDIDLDHKTIRVKAGKTNRYRIIPINDIAVDICRKWIKQRLGTHPRFWCLNQKNFYLKFRTLGLQVEPYQIRHTYGTELSRNKVPTLHVMKVMGHKSVKSAMGYQKVAADDLMYIRDIRLDP